MYNQGKIMRRLLGRPFTEAANDGSSPGVTSSPLPQSQSYRPNASQDAEYPSSVPIACIDRSPDGRTAVLGGRHILKTVQIVGSTIKDGVDVRSIILTAQHASKGNVSNSLTPDQLSIKDAKLASPYGPSLQLYTACANGKIFMYDVSRLGSGMGLEFIQTSEGSRQVNKLDFSPHRPTWLLAGGQDGIARCFDVKTPLSTRGGLTFRNLQRLHCNADAISDLRWAPKDGYMFACATESGVVLKWDIRKPTAPLIRINAHDNQKGASSIAWHADGDHLISAGLDSKCHVWDLSGNAERKQKPKWSINAPAPITCVRWRPGLWSATAQGRRAAQVAVSYDEGSNLKRYGISSVHIWDLARPTMPYKEIDLFETSPYSLLWHDQDLLWTAGQGGFRQCDVAFAPKVTDRQSLSTLDISPQGDVLMFLEERAAVPRPRRTISIHERPPPASLSSSPSGQTLSVSRSDSEEDVIGSFLGPKRRAGRKRRPSHRPTQTLSTTPPSGPGIEDSIINLEQALNLTIPFKPKQVMAIGRVPAATKVDTFRFLSRQYLEILERDLPLSDGSIRLDERLSKIMERYARAAESVSQFRLAQTWRILSYGTNLLLSKRSQYHLDRRLSRRDKTKLLTPTGESKMGFNFLHPEMSPHLGFSGEETPRNAPSVSSADGRQTPGRSLLAEEIDSESQVPTPLARPLEGEMDGIEEHPSRKRLTLVREIESFSLPPTVYPERLSPRDRFDSTPLSTTSQDSQVSSTEGYDFYDVDALENIPKAIEVPKKREPRVIDPPALRSPNDQRKPVARYDSDESLPQIFSISAGSRQTSDLIGSSGESTFQSAARSRYAVKGLDTAETEVEYGSRIRGKQIAESPEKVRYPDRRPIARYDSGGLSEDFLTSQTTADTFDSDSLHNDESYFPAPAGTKSIVNPIKSTVPRERHEEDYSPTIIEADFLPWKNDPPYPYSTNLDVNCQSHVPPINPYSIISRALDFESRRSALNAAAMILLLKPLVPEDLIDSYQATAILRQYHSRLMGMRLFTEAALLRKLCIHGWPEGIESWGDNYASISRLAQDRVAVGFICASCRKPREIDRSDVENSGIWKCERCRAVMAPCAVCGHREAATDQLPPLPISKAMAERSLPQPDETMLSTWWYCPGCAHGGHASCLQDWHAPTAPPSGQGTALSPDMPSAPIVDDAFPPTESGGCCPFDGCGHACLPGKWRNENNAARTKELGKAVREQYRGTVDELKKGRSRSRGSSLDVALPTGTSTPITSIPEDSIEAPQSKAVESMRERRLSPARIRVTGDKGFTIDDKEPAAKPSGLLSILSSSPGNRASVSGANSSTSSGPDGLKSVVAGGEGRERRKSVKFRPTD